MSSVKETSGITEAAASTMDRRTDIIDYNPWYDPFYNPYYDPWGWPYW